MVLLLYIGDLSRLRQTVLLPLIHTCHPRWSARMFRTLWDYMLPWAGLADILRDGWVGRLLVSFMWNSVFYKKFRRYIFSFCWTVQLQILSEYKEWSFYTYHWSGKRIAKASRKSTFLRELRNKMPMKRTTNQTMLVPQKRHMRSERRWIRGRIQCQNSGCGRRWFLVCAAAPMMKNSSMIVWKRMGKTGRLCRCEEKSADVRSRKTHHREHMLLHTLREQFGWLGEM